MVTTKSIPEQAKNLIADEGHEIEVVDCADLLGVSESSDMKWTKHVNSIVKRCSTRLYLLRTLKSSAVASDALLLFYHAKIRAILTYTYPAICSMPKHLLEKLISVERRVYKIIDDEPSFMANQARKIVQQADKEDHRLSYMFHRNARNGRLDRCPESKDKPVNKLHP